MKALLAKLLGMFRQSNPQKPVETWPFPTEEAIKKAKECCGGCDKPAKKKPAVKKATTRIVKEMKQTEKGVKKSLKKAKK